MTTRAVVSLEIMRHLAQLVGSDLSDAELNELRPTLEDLRQRVEQLGELGLEGVEPASIYRAGEA